MRTIKLFAIVLALGGARCTDTGDLQRMLRDALVLGADGEGAGQTVGDVARARPDTSGPGNMGQPTPAAGTMQARVWNTTDRSAEVTIRFLLNDLVVHLARLHVGPHTTTSIVGPDLAQVIEFTGIDEDGTTLPPETFVFGADTDEDTPAVYVISDAGEEEPPLPVDETPQPTDEPSDADEPQEPEEPEEEEGPPPGGGGGPAPVIDCNGNGVADATDIAVGTSFDCNLNLVPDECDIAAGTSQDCNRNDIPDECDITSKTHLEVFAVWLPCLTGPDVVLSEGCEDMDLDMDGDVDLADFAVIQRSPAGSSASHDCNSNGIPDECEIHESNTAPGGPFFCQTDCDPDCNSNGVPDACDIAAGTSDDCNTNGVPDECDDGTDLNENGVLDECEDCNGNGIPDDLDIDWQLSPDCNTNGVPDECDIADGTSEDSNTNGVPDECERVLYAVERWGPALYTLDPDTGVATRVADMWPGEVYGAYGLSFEPGPSGGLYAIVNANTGGMELATVDPDTAELMLVGPINEWVADIAFGSNSTLYGVLGGAADPPGEIVQIDPTDGSTTHLDIFGNYGAGQSIAFQPGTNVLYHTSCPEGCQLEAIDVDTGNATPVSTSLVQRYQALAYDAAEHRLLGASGGGEDSAALYAIDPVTGVESYLGEVSTHTTLSGMAFRPVR